MKQLLTRVDDELATAVKQQAAQAGLSTNTYVSTVLRNAVSSRSGWKAALITAGKLVPRGTTATPHTAAAHPPVSTHAGYASDLVSAERDEQ